MPTKECMCKKVCLVANAERHLAGHIRQMAITAPDLASTDLAQYFHPSYTFMEEALSAGRSVLVHCGAGSSRSATIAAGVVTTPPYICCCRVHCCNIEPLPYLVAAAYLMRKHRWSAARALTYLHTRRSSVSPNEGFWRQLCSFEGSLAIPSSQRSDVRAPPVMTETYGEVANIKVGPEAAGAKAVVDIRPARESESASRGAK